MIPESKNSLAHLWNVVDSNCALSLGTPTIVATSKHKFDRNDLEFADVDDRI
jgi:hypothetical protein